MPDLALARVLRRPWALALATALVAVVATLGIRSALAVTTTVSGDAVTKVKTLRSPTGTTRTGGTTFRTVPGAQTTIFVPEDTRAVILARFSAESRCSGGAGWCAVRILIGKVEAEPAAGNSFAFQAATAAGEYEAHAMERVRGPLDPGTYNVKVQWAVSDDALEHWLDDWLLVIERVNYTG